MSSVTKEELIERLDQIKTMLDGNEFNDFELYSMRDDLDSIISKDCTNITPEGVRCLVTGWWIRESIKNLGIDPDNPPPAFSTPSAEGLSRENTEVTDSEQL